MNLYRPPFIVEGLRRSAVNTQDIRYGDYFDVGRQSVKDLVSSRFFEE